MSGLALPKGPTRKQLKARAGRAEAKRIAAIRALTVSRDGYCRFAGVGVGPCEGPSEWAHFGEKQRWKTRGMDPEERHTTAGSLMACCGHHARLDRRQQPWLLAFPDDAAAGCDGLLRASGDGGETWHEAPTRAGAGR